MMAKNAQKIKAKRGRPPTYVMPEPIPDTPQNVLRAVLATPQMRRGEWKYMQDRKAKPTKP